MMFGYTLMIENRCININVVYLHNLDGVFIKGHAFIVKLLFVVKKACFDIFYC